ncbi:hypothetical protein OOK29_41955 [Streptomyces phaeochromogenes]|nr:hypothetical protein [Streptomyces phaeochromogenes]MCX5604717.1 hypothetical protein [Streptomyces phaeochromogenes]
MRQQPAGPAEHPRSPVTVGAGTVATDDPHFGMISQPRREGIRGAVRENVDGTVGGHVDQDRRVLTTAAHVELVNTEMRKALYGGIRQVETAGSQASSAG